MKFTLGRAILGAAALILAACATVPKNDRLLTSAPDNGLDSGTRPRSPSGPASSARVRADAFDRGVLRVLSWNIHKAKDAGLYHDLARLAAQNDLLLLQEAVLDAPIGEVLKREGFSWQMADAFGVHGLERGVLIAARVAPVDGHELRTYEPLFPLPKSAIVTHYRLVGRSQQLAVVDLHGINFSLGLGRFRKQLEAVARELKHHDGPMIFGGDFNTWSVRRNKVLGGVAKRLGLVEVEPVPDDRRRAFGRHLDHLFVRGFSVVDARSFEVKSSDHNPISVRIVAQHTRIQ